MFAGKKSAQIREILINESAWEEMTCLFAPSLGYVYGNEEKTNEIVKKHPGYVIKIFEEKMGNELKIRTRMMKILRNGKINIYEYMNILIMNSWEN
ncbi:hypothetical protein [Escherichia coli]|uniref:hypothetical protein n=1 Tax=Escherichia coli TaxID=562 RepID=UPI00308357EA